MNVRENQRAHFAKWRRDGTLIDRNGVVVEASAYEFIIRPYPNRSISIMFSIAFLLELQKEKIRICFAKLSEFILILPNHSEAL